MNEQQTLAILGAMHYPDGSGYYRYLVPFRQLDKVSRHVIGVSETNTPLFTDADLEQIDVISLQRPASKSGVRSIEKLVGKVALCYEVDDDLFSADSSALPHLHDQPLLESIRRCVRLSDIVTCSTPYLAERLRPLNDNVYVLPNYVEGKLLRNATHWRADLDPDRPVNVGWAGGSSHLIDWLPYADALRRVVDRNPQAEFTFAGFDYSPILGALRSRARWLPWQNDVAQHFKNVAGFDIGLAPLADEPFCRSKSWIRALECAAVGIPVVATDLEPYRDFVIDGKTGYLVRGPAEFADRVDALIADPEMRAEMGAAAKEHAAGYTIEANWEPYEQAYEACHAIYTAGQNG